MAPIVTTSRRTRPRRCAAFPFVAFCVLAALGLLALRAWRRPPAGGLHEEPAQKAPNEEAGVQDGADQEEARDPASSLAPQLPGCPEGVRGQAHGPLVSVAAVPSSVTPAGVPPALPDAPAAPPTPPEGSALTPGEQVIAMAMAAGPDGGPPLPMISEEEMRRDLSVASTNPVQILDSDDEATVELKRNIEHTKAQMLAIVQAGGSLTNALREYEEFNNQGAALRRRISSQYRELLKEKGEEEAGAFLEAANAALVEQGFDPVAPRRRREGRRTKDGEPKAVE